MQVAGNLAGLSAGLGFVAEDQAGDRDLFSNLAWQSGAEGDQTLVIVVAHGPDQLASPPEHGDALGVVGGEAGDGAGVVKAVAQQNHGAGVQGGDLRVQPIQRGSGVVGGQELAARGVARPLLQMQIAGHQHSFGLDPEGAGGAERHRLAEDLDPQRAAGRARQHDGRALLDPGGDPNPLHPLSVQLQGLGDQLVGVFLQEGVGAGAGHRFAADLQQNRHGEGRHTSEFDGHDSPPDPLE